MSATLTNQYQAYSLATRTVAKTRQVVMLYDGIIRFLQQAEVSIAERRIEDRFKQLQRASEIVVGLQSSIDFDNGGEVAHILHRFYTGVSMRILSINFKGMEGPAICRELIAELKQMRDVWDSIDRELSSGKGQKAAAEPQAAALQAAPGQPSAPGNVSVSA